MVVPPGEADAWARRIPEAVAGYAENALSPPLFRERLRRHRGLRLREMDTPEARAQAAARTVLLGRDGSGRLADVDGLDPDRLRSAARSLGEPMLVLLGPFLESSASAASDTTTAR